MKTRTANSNTNIKLLATISLMAVMNAMMNMTAFAQPIQLDREEAKATPLEALPVETAHIEAVQADDTADRNTSYSSEYTRPESSLPISNTPDRNRISRADIIPAPSQDFCIAVMSEFPQDDGTEESLIPRYQFYTLTQDIAVGATPEFSQTLTHYRHISENEYGTIDANTPILDIIEAIANPVIRQAAPELVVANMSHLVDFAQRCETYIDGQIMSLTAFNPNLVNDDLIIQEDALYLRQILSDSLSRLGADAHPVYGPSTKHYAASLILARDNIEFASFETELDDIEALYMSDLDGRLARSNDMINSEVNRETLGDAVTLAKDMNKASKRAQKEDQIRTIFRILNGF